MLEDYGSMRSYVYCGGLSLSRAEGCWTSVIDWKFLTIVGNVVPQTKDKRDHLLYSKIGAIAWRHLAIPVNHLIPCQIINFYKSAYKPTTTSNIIPINYKAIKLYIKRLY